MEGKICLVTGANAGIGKETCMVLARQGATVVMTARSHRIAEQVRSEIISNTGNPNIHLIIADLSSFQEVVNLTQEFKHRFEHLDVLVNNAGIFLSKYKENHEGHEIQWSVNYLAHYLLTRRLHELMVKSKDSRVINVSSNAHLRGKINFEDLNGKANYQGFRAYAQSKLANVLFSKEFAARQSETHVSSYSLHPGVVRTGIGNKNNQGWMSWIWKIAKPFMIAPSKGAETIIYLATAKQIAGLSGLYFVNSQPHPSSDLSLDKEVASRLWDVSQDALKKFL